MEKEERQELLEELMEKEIKKMRRVVKKYNHEPLIYTDVKIKESNLEENIAGRLTKDKNEDKWIIEIDESLINYCISAYAKEYGLITRFKKELKNTIGHELVHAWVDENYNIFFKDAYRDSSIIFLNALIMFGYTSHHDCWYNWRWNSNNVVKCANKKEFDKYVTSMHKKLRELEEKYSYKNVTKEYGISCQLKLVMPYTFNVYGLERLYGLESHCKAYSEGKVGKCTSKNITLGVGCLMDLDKLDQYIERALETDVSNYKIYNYIDYTFKEDKLIREINKKSKVA